MYCISFHLSVKKAIKIYGLKASFDKIADKLNNYVHSNGYFFYNESYFKLIVKQKIKALTRKKRLHRLCTRAAVRVYPSERGHNYTPPKGGALRSAEGSCREQMISSDFQSAPIITGKATRPLL